jgi:hypothetical protein
MSFLSGGGLGVLEISPSFLSKYETPSITTRGIRQRIKKKTRIISGVVFESSIWEPSEIADPTFATKNHLD